MRETEELEYVGMKARGIRERKAEADRGRYRGNIGREDTGA